MNRYILKQQQINNKKTPIYELNGLTHCGNCKKKLCRDTDIDVFCDICWDLSLMTSEEPGYNEYKKLIDEYYQLLIKTRYLEDKNKLLDEYNKKFRYIGYKNSSGFLNFISSEKCVCGIDGDELCEKCGKQIYCSKVCEKYDYDRHKKLCVN